MVRLALFVRPVLIAGMSLAYMAPGPAWADCAGLVRASVPVSSDKRPIEAIDLVRLRDIGPSGVDGFEDGMFALSPDASRLAFQLRRADPVSNSYCLGMFVLNLKTKGPPTEIDQGGDFMPFSAPSWGFARSAPTGFARTITPVWSSDGQAIAYLRRDQGITQVWIARADGSGARAATHLDVDVDAFAWGLDDRTLIVRAATGLADAEKAIDEEGRAGWHFDDRFMPAATSRPIPRSPVSTGDYVIDIATGRARPGTAGEAALLSPTAQNRPAGALRFAADPSGAKAWSASVDPNDVTAHDQLHVQWAHGTPMQCATDACAFTANLWFADGGHTLYYLRRPRGAGLDEIYRWVQGQVGPLRLLSTVDRLLNCLPFGPDAICGEEGALQPRRLIRLDLKTGARETLFDPNPEMTQLQTPEVRRLTWTNAYGLTTFGDLVVPAGVQVGQKLPLIVVGYNARGFLRGGTGDEFPILLYAAHGFAVLRYQTPIDIGYVRGAKTWTDMNRIAREDWLDFRSTTSTIETGVRQAVALGVVDPKRVGLTGFSYGATTAQFALVNSSMFAAAELTSCCEEGDITSSLMGPVMEANLHEAGYPSVLEDGKAFWQPMSLRLNARSVSTPILMQLPDRQYLGAMEGYTALREAQDPVDMFVFPDEYHVKWQPAHRLASYQRSLDWFAFWLQGTVNPDPSQAAMYDRWKSFRESKSPLSGVSPGP